jgi:hypothetical protein
MTKGEESHDGAKQLHCNHCRCTTNHVLHGQHKREYCEVDGAYLVYSERLVHRLWICAGCDTGTMEVAWTCSGNMDRNGDEVYDYTYYPERASMHLAPKQYKNLSESLTRIYAECIKSFNTGLPLLCAAGLRALIEGICDDKNISGGNLEKKINGLANYLPPNIVQSLHGFRFMGNNAMHELAPSDTQTLQVAIEVCEDLLNFLYELDYKLRQLPGDRRKKVSSDESESSGESP